ncbi:MULTISPECIES: hypothetical protein [Hymenobacter]|uniref:hypothetical protein n=1 Tax=Hymenobacter TaxID=89966 RepID=UPI001248B036|nr:MULTISPECIES: hypothetical protein [Hymenobacter]QKG52838.1 hypothetical protein GKZ67_09775 [Hymenobacter sp. BRD67]
MTFATFKNLHQRQQADYLTRHGHPLAQRTEDSFDLHLFAVGSFYAEVWRSRGEDAILFIHVFEHAGGLHDYLALISIGSY